MTSPNCNACRLIKQGVKFVKAPIHDPGCALAKDKFTVEDLLSVRDGLKEISERVLKERLKIFLQCFPPEWLKTGDAGRDHTFVPTSAIIKLMQAAQNAGYKLFEDGHGSGYYQSIMQQQTDETND